MWILKFFSQQTGALWDFFCLPLSLHWRAWPRKMRTSTLNASHLYSVYETTFGNVTAFNIGSCSTNLALQISGSFCSYVLSTSFNYLFLRLLRRRLVSRKGFTIWCSNFIPVSYKKTTVSTHSFMQTWTAAPNRTVFTKLSKCYPELRVCVSKLRFKALDDILHPAL